MNYIKMTRGFVAQHFDSETGDCVQQEFVPDADAQAMRQDEAGNAVAESDQIEMANVEKECPMDMVQP